MTTPSPAEMAEEIERLLKDATPGPWEWQNGCSWWRLGTRFGNGDVLQPTTNQHDGHPDLIVSAENREMITYLCNIAPRLIAALRDGERMAGEISTLKDKCAEMLKGNSRLAVRAEMAEARAISAEQALAGARNALEEIRDYTLSQAAALNMPVEQWWHSVIRDMQAIARRALTSSTTAGEKG